METFNVVVLDFNKALHSIKLLSEQLKKKQMEQEAEILADISLQLLMSIEGN